MSKTTDLRLASVSYTEGQGKLLPNRLQRNWPHLRADLTDADIKSGDRKHRQYPGR